jgi:CRISPR-associated protein Cmr5
MTTHTLDQQRAALAWQYAKSGMSTQYAKEYKGLAKGAPALIMNSGLMPTLAFYNGKGKAAQHLLDDLIRGMTKRLTEQDLKHGQGVVQFPNFMEMLQTRDSSNYLRHTDEALELLKWIRQFVDAVETGERA